MKLTRLFIAGILLLAAATAPATPLLEIRLTDKQQGLAFFAGGFDIVSFEDGVAKVVGWPDDIRRLESLGIGYEVVIDDLEAFYRARIAMKAPEGMGGYMTFDEIGAWAIQFAADHPDIVAGPDTIGYSLEERPLWVIKISDNPEVDEEEPEIFLNGAIHAREVITPLVLINFAELLADSFETDPRIAEIVNSREIWLLPVINPDGYTYNEERDPGGGGMWRKNKRIVDGDTVGVDLNRNFPFMWGLDDYGSSPDPDWETYRGDSAASEPETRAVIDFVNSRNFNGAINYHSFGNMMLYPYGYAVDTYPEDILEYRILSEYMNETLGWLSGTGVDILYLVNGDATDWMEGGANYNIFAFCFEVGTGVDGFWPEPTRIEPLTTAQEEPLMRLCETILEPPYYLLPPPVPLSLVIDASDEGYILLWPPVEEYYGNVTESYDVGRLSGLSLFDGAETGFAYGWEPDGFIRQSEAAYQSDWSYHSGTGNHLKNTLTAMVSLPVRAGDTLRFDTRYDIEVDWDYGYVQASIDGDYINLAGNITTNDNPEGMNKGNGITGSTGNTVWVHAEFPLDEYAGHHLRFRFLYSTDSYVSGEGWYIDNISPAIVFNSLEFAAEAVTDTFISIGPAESVTSGELWFVVRAIDGEGDVSQWCDAASMYDFTQVEEIATLPVKFEIGAVYPNPFNPTASLSITLPRSAEVELTLINILGREVARVSHGLLPAGRQMLSIDGSALASGIYFLRVGVRMSDGSLHQAIRKAVILK